MFEGVHEQNRCVCLLNEVEGYQQQPMRVRDLRGAATVDHQLQSAQSSAVDTMLMGAAQPAFLPITIHPCASWRTLSLRSFRDVLFRPRDGPFSYPTSGFLRCCRSHLSAYIPGGLHRLSAAPRRLSTHPPPHNPKSPPVCTR